MCIVKLNPNLLAVNARIRSRHALTAGVNTALSGTLYNGYNQATAQIGPGTTGTITVSFQIIVPSISSATFDAYRTRLQQILGAGTEQGIASSAGIRAAPPPAPASRMASYADELFSDLVFGGEAASDQSRAFGDCATPACTSLLAVMRSLAVTQVSFSGTLTASSASGGQAQVAAYIPITAVEFADGLTIPFAGYSDNVLVGDGGLEQLDVPSHFWSELPGVA